jgi:PleD family two-component response regulator
METMRRVHAATPNVPMIALTCLEDEALAAEAMKEGAQDYLIKSRIKKPRTIRALRHAIECHRMQMETEQIRF